MNQNSVQSSEEQSQPDSNESFLANGFVRLGFIALLLFCLTGMSMFPLWWYEFFFRVGFLNEYIWKIGIDYIVDTYLKWIILVGTVIGGGIFLEKRTSYLNSLKPLQSKVQTFIEGKTGSFILYALASIFLVNLVSLPSLVLSENYSSRVPDSYPLSNQSAGSSAYDLDNSRPLTNPATFIYLSENDVESLYSQYESELVPFKVTEELTDTAEVKAGISARDFFSTEAGKSYLQKKIIEYQQASKTPERMLMDLLHYLHDTRKLTQLKSLESNSSNILELDNAVNTLNGKYKITLNQEQSKMLESVREQLMSDELEQFNLFLGDVSGNILVLGNWTIENQVQSEYYVLKHALVDDVSTSPVCEINLLKTSVRPEYAEIINNLKEKPIRLNIFGAVVTNVSSSHRVIQINPIAIFLPENAPAQPSVEAWGSLGFQQTLV